MDKTSNVAENVNITNSEDIKDKQFFFNYFSNILPPIISGLISVIVNYGGTFILIFQAAQIAGLSAELTASWVWYFNRCWSYRNITQLAHETTNYYCMVYTCGSIFDYCPCNRSIC